MDYRYFCVPRFTLRLSSDSDSPGMRGKKRKKKKKKKTTSLDDTAAGEKQHLTSWHVWRDSESTTVLLLPVLPSLAWRLETPALGSRSKEGLECRFRILAQAGEQGERLLHTPRSRGSAIAQIA